MQKTRGVKLSSVIGTWESKMFFSICQVFFHKFKETVSGTLVHYCPESELSQLGGLKLNSAIPLLEKICNFQCGEDGRSFLMDNFLPIAESLSKLSSLKMGPETPLGFKIIICRQLYTHKTNNFLLKENVHLANVESFASHCPFCCF